MASAATDGSHGTHIIMIMITQFIYEIIYELSYSEFMYEYISEFEY